MTIVIQELEDDDAKTANDELLHNKSTSTAKDECECSPTNVVASKIGSLYMECFNEAERCINVIGGGKMAQALVNGLVNAGCFSKSQVFICTRSTATAQQWTQKGFTSAYANDQFYTKIKRPRGLVLLAIKPQVFPTFLEQMRANEWFYYGTPEVVTLSIMAGISLQHFDQQLRSIGFDGHTARLMPNVNCAIAAGTSLLCADPKTPNEFIALLTAIGSSVGSCFRVDEAQFNAASAIAGCGPAFVALVVEALSDGGVLSGLSRELANKLAVDMIKGTALLLSPSEGRPSPPSAAQLKEQVCSPAGTTIAGVRELESKAVRSAFIDAVHAASKRADELSAQMEEKAAAK